MRSSPDCFCTAAAQRGEETWCPPCLVTAVVTLRMEHGELLDVSRVTRRVPNLQGHEAAVLVEMSKRLLTDSVSHKARKNGQRYVEQGAPE